MFKLIGNENTKIYSRLRTWIMLGLLFVAIVLVAWVIHSHQHAAAANWKQVLMTSDAQTQSSLSHASHMPAAAIQKIKEGLALNEYYIAHNINPNLTTGWKFATTAQNLATLLVAFVVVVAGDVVASEFSTGTIKMLLTQTATRSKILASKYLAALWFGLLMMVSMLIFSLIVGWIFFGTPGAGEPHIYMDASQHFQQMSTVSYLLMQYGFLFIQILFTITIAFMISAMFRSSALAITISLLTYMVGNTLVNVLSSYAWVKYILFANTDLSQFVILGPSIHGLTLHFSILILLAYFVVMLVLSWLTFVRRDVAYT